MAQHPTLKGGNKYVEHISRSASTELPLPSQDKGTDLSKVSN